MNQVLTKTNTGIRKAGDPEQIRVCYKIMRQLRPHLTEEVAFVEQVQRQLVEGYHLAYLQEGEEVKKYNTRGEVFLMDGYTPRATTTKAGRGVA